MPDTQYYSARNIDILHAQVDWILDEKDRLNIRMVAHVGDVVDEDTEEQWMNAEAAPSKLAGEVPFFMVAGNHDYASDASPRSSMLGDYFNWNDFGTDTSLGGRFDFEGSQWNSYHYVETNSGPWLLLGLEFAPRGEVVDWARGVIGAHPEHKLIVVTHAYLYSDDTRYDYARFGDAQLWNPYSYGLDADNLHDAEELWQSLLRQSDGLRFVLSGHVLNDGLGRRSSFTDSGNVAHQILANYQDQVTHLDESRAESGYLRIMEFSQSDSRVDIRTYSPWLDASLDDGDNRFALSID